MRHVSTRSGLRHAAVVLVGVSLIAGLFGCSSSTPAGATDVDAGGADASTSPQGRVVVPVSVKQKYERQPWTLAIAIPVEIASPDAPNQRITVDLLLDTGSSGVSVFAESLGDVTLPRVGAKRTLTYGGGDVYEEQSANAVVGLGGVRTANPIHVSVVDGVHCASGTSCGGAAGPSYLTKQGFHGILGLGTRYQGDVFNPVMQLPAGYASSYVLDTHAGSLVLGATSDDTKDFKTYALTRGAQKEPNGAPTFDDRSLPVCANVGTSVVNDCASGLLDSGTWSLFFSGVSWGDVVDPNGTLKTGTSLEVDMNGVFAWPSTPIDDVVVSPTPMLGGFSRILGMPFFQAFDVMYDLDHGNIGVRPAR